MKIKFFILPFLLLAGIVIGNTVMAALTVTFPSPIRNNADCTNGGSSVVYYVGASGMAITHHLNSEANYNW
jgi:hypothetical protein